MKNKTAIPALFFLFSSWLVSAQTNPCIETGECCNRFRQEGVLDFSIVPGGDGHTFTFTPTFSGVGAVLTAGVCSATVHGWTWQFGYPGTPVLTDIAPATHDFPIPPGCGAGTTYTVTLCVTISTNGYLSTCKLEKTVTVPPSGTNSGYQINVTHLNCGQYYFSYSGPAVLTDPQWGFGDGHIGDGHTAVHTYLANGNYTATLYDAGNPAFCLMAVVVPVSGLPAAGFTYTGPACSLTRSFDITNYDASNTYGWNFNGYIVAASGAGTVHSFPSAGIKTVSLTVTNPAGCSAAASQVLNAGGIPADFNLLTPICAGNFLSVSNIPPGGTIYNWNYGDGATGAGYLPYHLYANSGVFPVTLTVTSAEGCVNSKTYSLEVKAPAQISAISATACGNTANIHITGSNFNQYTISFGDGQTQTVIAGAFPVSIPHTYSSPGLYTIQVTAALGSMCSASASTSVLIGPTPQLTLSAGATVICSDGQTELNGIVSPVPPGTTSITWQWTGPAGGLPFTGNNATVLEGGTYTLTATITGVCNLTLSSSIAITELPAPTGTLTPVSGACPGINNGSATLTVSPALAAIGYTVNGGAVQHSASLTLNNLIPGDNYLLIALDGHPECTGVISVTIPDNSPALSFTTVPRNCNGTNGKATVAISSGTGPYQYAWSNVQSPGTVIGTAATLGPVAAGYYQLSVTDQGTGCTAVGTVEIQAVSLLLQLTDPDPAVCQGKQVAVTVIASYSPTGYNPGGVINYVWYQKTGAIWVPVGGNTPVKNLPDGDYKVTAANPTSGCTAELLFTVGLNPPMNVALNIAQPNCPGGTATVEAVTNGGSGIYSFSWAGVNNPPNGPVVSGVGAGTVSVTVSDNAGCAATATGTVVANGTPMQVVLPVQVQACSLTVNLIGGVGPFFFEWTQERPVTVFVSSDFGSSVISQTEMQTFPVHEHQGDEPNTTSTASFPPGTGQYTLIVTDAFGCSISTPVTLTIPDEPPFPAFSFVWSKTVAEYQPPSEPDPIVRENMAEAKNDLFNAFDRCVQSQQVAFKTETAQNCFDPEHFHDQTTLEYAAVEGHHTLYYYDRAGRLTQTVPPEGVKPLDAAEVQAIKTYRKTGGTVPSPILPDHHIRTTYAYNSLGLLVQQNTPDGGASGFLYDNKSRLRFSQNARQQPLGAYSYTKYDELGRPLEAGESTAPGLDFANPNAAANLAHANDPDFPTTQLSQRTLTVYTDPAPVDYFGRPQRFLQNRVSQAYIDDDGDLGTTSDQHHTFYSYDVHGNVEWMIREDPLIGKNYLWYGYDLISGNVLEVRYNEYRADRLFHRYQYDSNNRLQFVETSTDGVNWDRDATYKDYYLHGPLRRMELGEDKVQGLDYTYTIHGWLKAVNLPGLDPAEDPGHDGQGIAPGNFPTDAWGMTLGYYQGDFERAGNPLGETETLYPGNGNADARDLYNGNISHWTQSQLEDNGGNGYNVIKARAGIYHYDVLNRIKASMHYDQQGGANLWTTRNNDYRTAYTFDANGNLETLQRYQNNGQKMDELVYDYEQAGDGHRLHNRLLGVNDTENGHTDGRGDLEGQHNYDYDPTGNLIRDFGPERLDLGSGYQPYDVELTMTWTAYGKVRQVDKKIFLPGTSTLVRREQLDFRYDASGNRACKTYARDLNNDGQYQEDEITESYYVRDAQGNEMAFYRRSNAPNGTGLFTATLTLEEQILYGSDQLGSLRRNLTLATADYAAGDLPIFQIPEENLARRSEYQHWITSANRTAPLCESRIASVTFDPANNHQFTPQSDLAVFLGTTRNGVAVAENLQGDPQFYMVLADGYLGGGASCLIFDREGFLMDGAELPGAPDPDCKPVIVQLPGSAQFAVALLDDGGQPVYHVVDMAETGFGTAAAPLGRVTQAGLPLETAAPGATYGRHFSGYEDQLNGRTVVYHTRYTPDDQDPNQGQTEIRACAFAADPLQAPQTQTLYNAAGYGPTADGELQIGPEGDRLLWYQHSEQVAGFAHRNVQLHLVPLGADKITAGGTATVRDASPAGNYGEGSADLHAGNAAFFYSQRGVYLENGTDKNVWYFRPTPTPTTLPLSPTGVPLLREVRRAADGRYYVPMIQAPANALQAYDPSGPTLSAAAITPSQHALASSLPVQVYKFGPVATDGAYSRMVGTRQYWLKDHLGSVRVTVGDEKSLVSGELRADVEGWGDYYPFGMGMWGRGGNTNRYGFQGQERDNNLKDNESLIFYTYRIYDTRSGKFFSVDPLETDYPWNSPFSFSENRVIDATELEGLEMNLVTNDEDHEKGIFAYGMLEDPHLYLRDETSWEFKGFKIQGITLDDGYRAFLASRIDKAGTTYLSENCNCDMYQEAYVITPEGYGNFVKEAEDYWDKSKNQFNYDITWGRMDNGSWLAKAVKGYMWGAATNRTFTLLGKTGKIIPFKKAVSSGTSIGITGVSTELTTVGRWMSKAEYEMMAKTGQMVEGGGGQTFVATGGPNAFSAAVKGSVYAEFQVPTKSLLQGGQANWFKVIGPNAGKAMQAALQKQGGQMLPKIQNLSPILKTN